MKRGRRRPIWPHFSTSMRSVSDQDFQRIQREALNPKRKLKTGRNAQQEGSSEEEKQSPGQALGLIRKLVKKFNHDRKEKDGRN